MDGRNHLTEDGIWASQLRLDQPLLIAECLIENALPRDNEALLAAVIASFVCDRSSTVTIVKSSLPKRLNKAYNRVTRAISPLAERMTEAGFDIAPLPLWASAAIYGWAAGASWDRVIHRAKVADGDLAMLISRTADSLHQIASLKDTHPREASLAAAARRTILREPVVFD